jgi:dolichol kinase
MLAVYHEDPLPTWNLAVVVAVVALLTGIGYRYREAIARAGESWIATCLIYPLIPTLVLCLFPARAELASVVLVVLALGDAAAGLGGTLLAGPRLTWNPAKTVAGTLCFVAASLPAATLIYWAEASPTVPLSLALACGTAAALLAAAAESLPLRGSDNLRVGLAAAVGVVGANAIWSTAA